jgi:hypothetical protein
VRACVHRDECTHICMSACVCTDVKKNHAVTDQNHGRDCSLLHGIRDAPLEDVYRQSRSKSLTEKAISPK